MKAKITAKQVSDLSEEATKRLCKWWKIRAGDWFFELDFPEEELLQGEIRKGKKIDGYKENVLPLMDITMMIRFLRDMANRRALLWGHEMTSEIDFPIDGYESIVNVDKLCDTLWGEVREILEHTEL